MFDRDCVTDPHVDTTTLLKGTTAIDPNQLASHVKQRSAGIAWIDGSIGLNAIAVFQDRVARVLVPTHPANQAVGNGRLKVRRQDEWVARSKAPLPNANIIAVADAGTREIVAANHLQNR